MRRRIIWLLFFHRAWDLGVRGGMQGFWMERGATTTDHHITKIGGDTTPVVTIIKKIRSENKVQSGQCLSEMETKDQYY